MTADEAVVHSLYLQDLRPDGDPDDPHSQHCDAVDAAIKLMKAWPLVEELLARCPESSNYWDDPMVSAANAVREATK